MNKGNRRALTYLLISAQPQGMKSEVCGTTRLQKMLYLLEKDYKIDKIIQGGYEFEAYRFGPYSKELYDDIEFLENLRLITSEEVDLLEPAGREEEDAFYSGVALSAEDDSTGREYRERCFRLTEEGRKKLSSVQQKLKTNGVPVEQVLAAINEVKAKYGAMPLSQLIHYVYRKYPESAVNSELRHLL